MRERISATETEGASARLSDTRPNKQTAPFGSVKSIVSVEELVARPRKEYFEAADPAFDVLDGQRQGGVMFTSPACGRGMSTVARIHKLSTRVLALRIVTIVQIASAKATAKIARRPRRR
jgi:hypothetical protein